MPSPIPSRSSKHPTLAASIIIPTFNRSDALLQCLKHLELQTCDAFEVIVVDDGSPDTTPAVVQGFAEHSPLHIVFKSQQNSGQSKARNLAIPLAKAPVTIMIGDDTWPRPDFVEKHINFHRQHPEENIAALGLTRWHETAQEVTPFMRWLENGFQFDYVNLLNGKQPDWRHFYTSNISVKTELIRRYPFDERLRFYEDLELGYRLSRLENLRIVFLPEAIADHVHPTDLGRTCKRAFEIGRYTPLMQQCCPDIGEPQNTLTRRLVRAFLVRNQWLRTPIRLTVQLITRIWCPNPFLNPLLGYYIALGRDTER